MNSKTIVILFLSIVFPLATYSQVQPEVLQLLTASGHPMQYYVSLPRNWTASREWPVVVVLEGAEKKYRENIERFMSVRGDLPFILIAPIQTNNGKQGRRNLAYFPYSAETWDYIEKVGDCVFDDDGLKQVMADVHQNFKGEERYFVTGFESGAHFLWSLVFNHPEYLRGAAAVNGNFRRRCVDETAISRHPAREKLPIMAFASDPDHEFGPWNILQSQWFDAQDLAQKNGYTNVTGTIVRGKGHMPLPDEVMKYFGSLLEK